MARKDSENQKKSMSRMFRGKAIFKPLNTGRIDEHVACVREWIANIFFYTKNDRLESTSLIKSLDSKTDILYCVR